MGGCRCTFRTCKVSTQKYPNMSFFHYPLNKKDDRLEKWIQNANYSVIKTQSVTQARNRSVCGLHFKDDNFMNYKKNRLTATAIPSLDRLKNGKVLDYSLGENPAPTTLPPTKDEHLIPPPGAMVWGHSPDYWNSYSTIIQYYNVRPKAKPTKDAHDYTIEPAPKKTKIIEVTEMPRILNNGIRVMSNVSLSESFELDDTTSISLADDVFPQDDQVENDQAVVDSSNIELAAQAGTSHVPNRIGSNVVCIDDVEFLTVDPSDSVEETVSKSTFDATCRVFEGEIAFLKNEMLNQEIQDEKEIAELKSALDLMKEKLQQSGNMATTWKFRVAEFERRVSELETKNQELLMEKAAEQPPVTPRSTATLPSSGSLTKAQLFNGIKKYLSASMTALVRMEMFGSSERAWKADEKQVSVELLKLGEDVYKYFRDEWRFRLPPKKMVEKWTNEVAEEDVDDL